MFGGKKTKIEDEAIVNALKMVKKTALLCIEGMKYDYENAGQITSSIPVLFGEEMKMSCFSTRSGVGNDRVWLHFYEGFFTDAYTAERRHDIYFTIDKSLVYSDEEKEIMRRTLRNYMIGIFRDKIEMSRICNELKNELDYSRNRVINDDNIAEYNRFKKVAGSLKMKSLDDDCDLGVDYNDMYSATTKKDAYPFLVFPNFIVSLEC